MKILFDQGTPVPLRRFLHPDIVDTASEMGWAELENGNLLAQAEKNGYEVLITTKLVWAEDCNSRINDNFMA